jgi:hypothetical protein
MVNGGDIQAAERTLRIVYGGPLDRQLGRLAIDRDAFERFVGEKVAQVKTRYPGAWQEMDPRLEPAINTLLVHFFLTGLICGHNEMRAKP